MKPIQAMVLAWVLVVCASVQGAEPGYPSYLAEYGNLLETSSLARTISLMPDHDLGVVVGLPGQAAVRVYRRSGSADAGSSEVVGELGIDRVSIPIIADVNGDAREDICLLGGEFGGVVILLQDGSGGFAPAPQSPLPTPLLPRVPVIGDYNGDGYTDIALLAGESLLVYHGGEGGLFDFPMPIDIRDLTGAGLLASGPIDADAGDELIVQASSTSQFRVVSWAHDAGEYEIIDRVTFRSGLTSVHVADFEGDGDQDIIGVGSSSVIWAQVAEGIESGFLVHPSQSATSIDEDLTSLVDDLDDDGLLDVVATTRAGTHIFFGRFESQVPGFVARSPGPLPIADISSTSDFTGDGLGDLLFTYDDRWCVFPNDGFRFRNAPFAYDLGDDSLATQVIPAPWTDQGNPVFLVNDFNQFRMRRLVLEFSESGTNGSDSTDPSLLSKGTRYRFADLDGDGSRDLLRVTDPTSGIPAVVRTRIATGPGTFLTARDVPSSFISLDAWIPTDLNGDGADDVVLAGEGENQLEIMLGEPGGFLNQPVSLGISGSVQSLAAGDFDGDGIEDLAIFVDAKLEVIYGDRLGRFEERKQFNFFTGINPTRVDGLAAAGDTDGDGLADLAWIGVRSGSSFQGVRVLRASPGRQFESTDQFLSIGLGREMIRMEDLNNDGRRELLVLSSGLLIFGSDATGRFDLVDTVPIGSDAGIETLDVNGDDLMDVLTVRRESIGVFFATGGYACRADLYPDGELNFLDLGVFLGFLGEQNARADFTMDGVVNFLDLASLLESFSRGCPASTGR